jgi:hypothetical protein
MQYANDQNGFSGLYAIRQRGPAKIETHENLDQAEDGLDVDAC